MTGDRTASKYSWREAPVWTCTATPGTPSKDDIT